MMVDFHSHVLPAMDDGAKDVDTALAMLRMAADQGAEAVVATPHFYGDTETVATFLARRQQSYACLRPHLTSEHPTLYLGAEVLMQEGLSKLDLRPLCLQGTDILLLEMPFYRLPPWLFEEAENIALGQRLTLMLAHLDRYIPWYSAADAAMLAEIPDALIQLNASSLADKPIFRALRKWLPDTCRLVLGSDMHNTTNRAPQLQAAQQTLSRNRHGRVWLENMDYTARVIMD